MKKSKTILKFSCLILLSFICSALFAQERTLTGSIVDSSTGDPLPGATIGIKGKPSNVTANANGIFKIKVQPSDVSLIVSFIGYKRQEVPIGSESFISVKLVSGGNKDLNDVVVVGYGEQKKITLTGAITTVDPKKIEDMPALNLGSLLVGQVPGLSISTSTQRPGGAVSTVVRNPVNLSKNGTAQNTLYIIDDVVRSATDFNLLDPSEIESISVLKDGEAAIYGVNGANGAILVRTKKGNLGAPKFSFSGSFGTANAAQLPKMMSGYQLATWINDYYQMQYLTGNPSKTIDSLGYINGDPTNKLTSWYTPDELAYFKANNNNYLDQAFKAADVYRFAGGVSGGTEKVRYYIGGDYTNQNSNFSGINSYKWGIRANVEAKPAKGLTVGVNLSNSTYYSRSYWYKTNGTTESLDQDMVSLLTVAPWQKYFIDGNPVLLNTSTSGATDIDNVNFFLIQNSNNYTKNLNYITNIQGKISYEIPGVKGLTAGFVINDNINNSQGKQYGTTFNYYQYSGTGENNHIPGGTISKTVSIKNGDRVRLTPNYSKTYQLDASLNYQTSIGKHHLHLLGIYEQTEFYSEGVAAEADGVIITGLDNQNYTTGDQSSNQASMISESGKLSYIGRANYDYDNKYLFQGVFRRDGSSGFTPGHQYGNFGSLSAGWVISQERFAQEHLKMFNLLKLRFSLGMVGNDLTGNGYQYTQLYSYKTGSSGGAVFNEGERGLGIVANLIPNPDVSWDNQTKLDYGIDMAFLNSRLTVTGDYFWNHGYNILSSLSSSVPATVGQTTPVENYGIVNMFGYELDLGWHDNISKDFSYNVRTFLSWSDDKNIREDISPGLIGTVQDRTGKSDDGGVFGYKYAGMFRTQQQVNDFMAAHPGYTIFGQAPEVGMLNYVDQNGDNQITTDYADQVYLSHKSSNHYSLGFNFGVTYKSLSLNVVSGMSWGGQGVIPGNEITQFVSKDITENKPVYWADHWTPDNTNAKYPAPYWYQDYNVTSNFWFVNSFRANIQTVNLSYTLPSKWTNSIGVSSIRAYAVCYNVLNLYNPYPDDYRDPSTSLYSYPNLRTLSFGLNIGF